MRIYLDNILIPEEEHSDLRETSITYNLKSTDDSMVGFENNMSKSFSSNITFLDGAHKYIYEKLVCNNPQSTNIIRVKIVDDCCEDEPIFLGKITQKELDYCLEKEGIERCTIEAKVLEDTQLQASFDCFRSKIPQLDAVIDGVRFEDIKHPFIRTCTETRPRIMQDFYFSFFYFLAGLLSPFVFIVLPLFLVIDAIVYLLNTIAGLFGYTVIDWNGADEAGNGSLLLEYYELLTEGGVSRWLTQCGKGILSPKVNDIIKNYCVQCGLEFKSSIINSNGPYSNLVYAFNHTQVPGNDMYTDAGEYIDRTRDEHWHYNFINENGAEFMNNLKKVFNGRWDIVTLNGVPTLIFEKKTYQYNELFDLNTLDEDKIISVCFSHTPQRLPAGTKFEYQPNYTNMIAEENKLQYNDIVDWKDPVYGYAGADLVGMDNINFPFSKARFMSDGITRSILRFWTDPLYAANSRFSYWMYIFFPFYLQIVYLGIQSPFFWPAFRGKFNDYMLTQNGTSGTPTLLVWDGENYTDALVIRQNIPGNDFEKYYNWRMWVSSPDDILKNGVKPYIMDNLFNHFFIDLENPNLRPMRGVMVNISLIADCDMIILFRNKIEEFGNQLNFRLEWCGQQITTYEIHTIEISNSKINIVAMI